jgi:hypothetical protein
LYNRSVVGVRLFILAVGVVNSGLGLELTLA